MIDLKSGEKKVCDEEISEQEVILVLKVLVITNLQETMV